MRNRLNILFFCALAMVATGFISCSEDDLGPSIFDTNDYPLDRTEYCFPLDTFLKVNFLEPYNVKFIYRMEDIGSDMTKNLTPARYEKSIELAVLAKYLWYDVYAKYGTDRFLKENSPRIIHVIGSKNLNPSQGTEILGVAEGGLKISLYNVNSLNYADIDNMNEYFFKTMHHEFGHILDQTHLRPSQFNLISRTLYDASTWTNLPDSMAFGRGFVSPYAGSAAGEDWVEVLSNYITRDSISWAAMMRAASFEWEEVDMTQSEYNKRVRGGANRDTVGYYRQHENGEEKVYRKVCARNADDYVALDENGHVQWLDNDGVQGDKVILQKLDMVRAWLKDNWNINLDDLRYEVQRRQYATNPDGTFKVVNGVLVNHLTQPAEEDPSVTLMEYLKRWVTTFEQLKQ